MLGSFDTCGNVPESAETLKAQQAQLVAGKRPAQMFPVGTDELPLPSGFKRLKTNRGVYHYNPNTLKGIDVLRLSGGGLENRILNLGPYNKTDVLLRVLNGEKWVCIVEYNKAGVELRAAVGSDSTVKEQLAFFENTKDSEDSRIEVGQLPPRVLAELRG